jgi:hypothetical protein
MYYIMSVFLNRFPLQRLTSRIPLKKYMSCQCPHKNDMLSTTFKVNFFVYMCTAILFVTTYKTATLIKEDTLEIRKLLMELAKK